MSQHKGVKRGPNLNPRGPSKKVLLGGTSSCACGCGQEFENSKACNGRPRRFWTDACYRKDLARRKREGLVIDPNLSQWARAAKATREKRDNGELVWRDPKFVPAAICHNAQHFPAICRHYKDCSDQSVIGGLWKYEANGMTKWCWEAMEDGAPGAVGISSECKVAFRKGAHMGAE